MPRLQFGITAFQRGRGDLPELPVENMFLEKAPTEETGIALLSRPGHDDRGADMGTGPVRALFKGDGVLDSGLYGVSGDSMYSGTTLLGAIDGTGPVSMDGYENYLFAAAGASLWGYDGTTLAAVAFPDSASVAKVVVGASRLIAIRADTEKFYWSDALTTTIDSLSFATAESQPDRLKDMLFIDDVLILFGAGTVEFWPNTGDSALPFQPLEGRVFERGIKATGCATKIGSTFAWVTDTNQVCMSDPENIISEPGLEALVEASADVSLWTFQLEGTEFLALRIDAGTWVYSARSRTWGKFSTYGADNWAAQCFAGGVFGSDSDGKTLAWGSGYTDLGGVLERRIRAGLPINAGGMTVNNLIVRCNIGHTTYLSGTYSDPTLEARFSRDAGQTWSAWRSRSLGEQGKYRTKVQWTACGMFGQPGLLVEFRVTDPVNLRISDVLANEPYGGF
jgi:hypothetical protein